MEWYGPLTVLPAIGLLILSTANFIISLNNEISDLEKDKDKFLVIINLKLHQLHRLGIANALLCTSALLFLIAGLTKIVTIGEVLFFYLILGGVITTTVALVFLSIHSIRSVQIRQKHLKL